jgi:hypothetical protein
MTSGRPLTGPVSRRVTAFGGSTGGPSTEGSAVMQLLVIALFVAALAGLNWTMVRIERMRPPKQPSKAADGPRRSGQRSVR